MENLSKMHNLKIYKQNELRTWLNLLTHGVSN